MLKGILNLTKRPLVQALFHFCDKPVALYRQKKATLGINELTKFCINPSQD